MKFKKLVSLALCALLSISAVGCSSSNSDDDKVIKVGATLVPGGELLKELEPLIEERGYKLDITIFDDYVLPNEALNNKEIDANLFQHKPYLDEAVASKGYEIMAGSKCLKYFQDLGLIKVKDSDLVGVKDIIENPRGLEFVELDVAQIPVF